MARQGIFTGFTPNDGLGDSLASGAVKVNANFQEIYDAFGDGNNLSPGAGAGGTWSKANTYGISTSKYVGIGTDLPTSQLHVVGNSLLQGITTGTFVGDGSGLTGVTATGDGVILKDNGVQRGVAQTLNFGDRLNVSNVFQGDVDITVADYVSYATNAGFATYAAVAGIATLADNATTAGVATYAPLAGIATFATTAGIVTYSGASGVATNAGVAEYAKLAGVSTYAVTAGVSTLAGYATSTGISTVARNLTGNPSITIENINSITGIVTVPGQGSKMRFDFDSVADLPQAVQWRGMFAYANNTKSPYVSFGTTNGGYQGWRRLLAEDIYGNYETTGVITATRFAGDASGLYNLPSTDAIWRSNPTGIVTASNVGIGTTNAEEKLVVLGNFLLKGRIVGAATTNILPFLYATYADLPSASDYHGAFAHVHETGKAYYAHSNAWVELVNVSAGGTVGTGTETYNVGHFQADQANILGVVTATNFVGDGSGLTGITASGTGIEIKDEGSVVGTAGTINFVGSAVTTTFGSGIATVTISGSGGGAGVLNDLSDVVTSGVQLNNYLRYNGSVWTPVAGISTQNADNVRLNFGTSDDLRIYHDGTNSWITDSGSGSLFLDGSDVFLQNGGSTKLQVTNGGLNVTGILTATGFSGDFYVTESVDDDQNYNLMMLDTTAGGDAYRGTMVDAGGITFNPNDNTLSLSGSINIQGLSGQIDCTNVNATGIITANTFYGDGSNLTGVSGGGIGTDGSVNTTGIITASSFVGDGSGLTGVVGSGSGVIIQDSGSPVGTAGTIDFGTNLTVSAVSAGVVTVTASGGSVGSGGTWGVSVTGIHTNKSVGIGTDIIAGTQSLQIRNTVFESHGVASSSFTASAGTPQEIDVFVDDFMTAEYTIHIINGNNYQAQKALVMHTGAGTTAYVSEYGVMFEPNRIADVSVALAAGQIQVSLVPLSGISGVTTYRFTSQKML
jgi:hypothetical protein